LADAEYKQEFLFPYYDFHINLVRFLCTRRQILLYAAWCQL